MDSSTIFINGLIWVPKDAIDVTQMSVDLTVQDIGVNKSREMGWASNKAPAIRLWTENETHYGIPRGYVPTMTRPVSRVIDMRMERPSVHFPAWRRQLRPNQYAPMDALIKAEGDALLCLGCGKGKTTLALFLAHTQRDKTLIIVDREYIADQWEREIKACMLIPRKAVGRVQGDTIDIGKHFTIAIINTLSQREYDDDFYTQFGLVIVDEAHVLGATTFSQVLPRFEGRRLLLTATPDRKDGLDPVFRYHAGGLEPCYVDVTRERSSVWYFKRLPRLVSREDESTCFQRLRGKTKRGKNGKREPVFALMRPRFESFAASNPRWEEIIMEDVAQAVKNGRNLLVLGGRKEQLEKLCEAAHTMGIDAGLVTSRVKKTKDREEAFTKRVLFATWQLASKALDIARMDTLYLFFPTNDVGFLRQAVGRIDREFAGKKTPVVVTYDHSYCDRMKSKIDDMMEAILEVDPSPVIKRL